MFKKSCDLIFYNKCLADDVCSKDADKPYECSRSYLERKKEEIKMKVSHYHYYN